MTAIDIHRFTSEQLQEVLDVAKTVVVASLVAEGHLKPETGEAWCANHTILILRKNLFRTVSSKWGKTKETSGGMLLKAVKFVESENSDE